MIWLTPSLPLNESRGLWTAAYVAEPPPIQVHLCPKFIVYLSQIVDMVHGFINEIHYQLHNENHLLTDYKVEILNKLYTRWNFVETSSVKYAKLVNLKCKSEKMEGYIFK